MTGRRGCAVAAAALLSATAACAAPASAGGPSFDCARAQGEVEALICRDASLAALDRRLAAVYRAAQAQARGPLVQGLRAEQRGWVKGRNDCWKARGIPTWITATWTVDSVPACVAAQYRLRTAELQAVWRLLPPRTTAYACQAQAADELVVSAFDTDPPTVRLERGDRAVTLWQVGAPDSGHFEGRNVSLDRDAAAADTVRVDWLNTDTGQTEALRCRAR